MPNKHNAGRRQQIPKMKFKVKNWAEYDAGLRRRGSLTLWVTPVVLDGWMEGWAGRKKPTMANALWLTEKTSSIASLRASYIENVPILT